MKTLITTLLFLFAFSTCTNAERIKVSKTNGGTSGYYNVREEHNDPIIGETVHTLDCFDPGNQSCSWTTPPSRAMLIGYAEHQIDLGVLTGSYSTMIEGVEHTVDWSATDSWNATIIESFDDEE